MASMRWMYCFASGVSLIGTGALFGCAASGPVPATAVSSVAVDDDDLTADLIVHHRHHHQVADDQDGEIGRRVVGRVLGVVVAADRAGRGDLQVAMQDRPLAAVGAVAGEAAPEAEGDGGLGHGVSIGSPANAVK